MKMAKKQQLLTTSEFAARTGISTSTVSKMIREGKIKAEKMGRKWMIAPDQLKVKAVGDLSKGRKKAGGKTSPKADTTGDDKKTKPAADTPAGSEKTYSVAEFAAMTYLTEVGVKQWLEKGRLSGKMDENGQWCVDAANLEAPGFKRLIREVKK